MATEVKHSLSILPPRWRRADKVLHEAFLSFLRENSLMVSASIAYHCLLAIFPLMLLLLALSGLYISRFELFGRFAVVLQSYLPMKPDFILQNLVGISRAYGRVGVISFLLLLWSSSGVFLPLEGALNRAWEVEKSRPWWRSRLVALEMAVVVGFLILISSLLVGVNVYIHSLMHRWVTPSLAPLAEFAYHLLIIGTTFAMTLAMFVVIFERLPNRDVKFTQVLPSALLTALFWEAARSLFALLLPLFNYHHVYGSIGVVIGLMTWAYVSSAVMLYGAQVSRALYRTLKKPVPSEPGQAVPELP